MDLSPSGSAATRPAAQGPPLDRFGKHLFRSVDTSLSGFKKSTPPRRPTEDTSSSPYLNPVQIPEALATDLIPRALWPGKPILDPGYQFSQEYYGTPAAW